MEINTIIFGEANARYLVRVRNEYFISDTIGRGRQIEDLGVATADGEVYVISTGQPHLHCCRISGKHTIKLRISRFGRWSLSAHPDEFDRFRAALDQILKRHWAACWMRTICPAACRSGDGWLGARPDS